MRVIAGQARSLKLATPEGDGVRPTTDRTKETLFNMLNPYVYGSCFLDVFSGSGAIGIEALSRDADKVFFVESARESLACINQNLKHTKLEANAEVIGFDYIRALNIIKDRGLGFDLIFLDPPYNKGFEEKAIHYILNNQLLKSHGRLVCESAVDTDFSFINWIEGYVITKTKIFASNKFTFIMHKDGGE